MIKKITLLLIILLCFGNITFANSNIGILLLGTSEYSEDKFLTEVCDIFKSEKSKTMNIHVGSEEQAKYQDYWFNKGFLDAPKPTTNDLIEYVQYSGYDEILFLFAKKPKTGMHYVGLFGAAPMNEASVEVKGYLIGENKLLASYSSTNKEEALHDESRACFKAFKKSVKEIHKKFINKS